MLLGGYGSLVGFVCAIWALIVVPAAAASKYLVVNLLAAVQIDLGLAVAALIINDDYTTTMVFLRSFQPLAPVASGEG